MTPTPIRIGLVQVNNSFSGQNYLPYSVACLRSYAEKNLDLAKKYSFLPFIYNRLPISQMVDHLVEADLVGFSTYVWNIQISLEVARRLKVDYPNTYIVFGGPQVPDMAEEFLRQNPFIDMVFHGESEVNFTQLLESYPAGKLDGIAGTSYLDASGAFVSNATGPRLRDLDEIPSPFLNGIFDQLIKDHPEESWIGLWETNRGCPFKCSYCDWGSAVAAKVTKFQLDRLLKEADWISENKIEYVFVCDANFGMLSRDIDIVKRVAENSQRTGYPHGFSVQNTKNATERAYSTQIILAEAGLNKGVALSMQSMSPEALTNIRRDNISLDGYLELQQRFARDGIETFSDLILGLPGDTYDSFADSVDQLIENGQHNRIQFNNCAILPNAEMGDPDYIKKYQIDRVETEIINIHGKREILSDDVAEFQELVVATYSLSREQWRRCRVLSWMSALLHFNKILQIPLIVVRELAGIQYRHMIEAFIDADSEKYPHIGSIRDFFMSEAKSLQLGGSEYVHSHEWLDIYWPADEYIFIDLTVKKNMEAFYMEAENLLLELCRKADAGLEVEAPLKEAVKVNRCLIHQPFVFDDIEIELEYDIVSFYDNVRCGNRKKLEKTDNLLRVERAKRSYDDLQAWCQEIVWWGNKKGAYLYPNNVKTKQLAGHY